MRRQPDITRDVPSLRKLEKEFGDPRTAPTADVPALPQPPVTAIRAMLDSLARIGLELARFRTDVDVFSRILAERLEALDPDATEPPRPGSQPPAPSVDEQPRIPHMRPRTAPRDGWEPK